MTSRQNKRQSTLRWAMWLTAETAPVKFLIVWTMAEAEAGGTPRLIRSVLEMTPNAIPRAPSIICAMKPTRMKGRRSAGPTPATSNIVGMDPPRPAAIVGLEPDRAREKA